MNIDGSRMKEEGIHYNQTYTHVAPWNSTRILLTPAASKGWRTKQIDYILAFPRHQSRKKYIWMCQKVLKYQEMIHLNMY